MADVKWRECVIRPTSYEIKPEGWRPQARVMLGEGAIRVDQDLLAPDGIVLDSKKKANEFALRMATEWIDQNHPFRPN